MNFKQEPEQIDCFFFLRAPVWNEVARSAVETEWEMQKASVSASSLSLLEGICYLGIDKGNRGVSVYRAALIASLLKDPTYSTLIDSWQHTEGGFRSVFWW